MIQLRPAPWWLPLSGALVLMVVIAIAIATTTGGSSQNPSRYVRPRIPPGVKTRQDAMALERRVLNIVGAGSRITSVVWLPDRQALQRRLPSLGTGPGLFTGHLWLVRAHGLFQLLTVPPGGHQNTKLRDGWYVFDDKTGVSLAYGF